MSALYESVVDVFTGRFGIDRDKVQPDASFDDIDLDSLSQIELATALKKKFAVEITDDEMAEMAVVSEVVAKLAEKGVTV
ncbi:MAG: acyl carrier protein [Pseudonocardiaceae bacterium]